MEIPVYRIGARLRRKVIMPQRVEIDRFRWWNIRRVMAIERASFGKDAYSMGLFRDLYRECADLFVVARAAGRVAGYAVSCAREREGEVVSIAVDPGARGSGVGRALLAYTLKALAGRGARRVELTVRPENATAIRFYHRFGFRRAGLIRRYYEDGGDAWLMRRALRASR